jgi:tRNA threonylcarbamoyladenosine biosynthesis protein TsaB
MAGDAGVFLGIETSGEYTGLALVRQKSTLARRTELTKARHNERIFELLDQLLEQASVAVDQLEGIGVVIGPGMFTSLRVGLAVAKAIAASRTIPLRGLNTLDAMVLTTLNRSREARGRSLLPLIDAHKGEVYCALYDGTTRRGEYLVRPPAGLASLTDSPITVCCNPGLPYRTELEAALGGRASFFELDGPAPELVAAFARDEIVAGRADNTATLSPYYLRRTDAELHREATVRS